MSCMKRCSHIHADKTGINESGQNVHEESHDGARIRSEFR